MSDDDPIKQFLQQPHVFNDEINCVVSSSEAGYECNVDNTNNRDNATSDCNNGNITTRTLINNFKNRIVYKRIRLIQM